MLNDIIKDAIAHRKPMAFGKIGATECRHIQAMRGGKLDDVWWEPKLDIWGGVFPLDHGTVTRWCKLYIESIKCLDGAVTWLPEEVYGEYDKELLRDTPVVSSDMDDLMPLAHGRESWHYALADKRVLVVHPMVETIRLQATRFSNIWPGASLGKLLTVQAPYPPRVAARSPFPNYFAALEWMKKQIAKHSFDLALVGVGAYSLPLLQYIKGLGVPCIHLGGKLQLLFGILGRRWDRGFSTEWKQATGYNSSPYWIRPLSADTPCRARLVEDGCYW